MQDYSIYPQSTKLAILFTKCDGYHRAWNTYNPHQ